MQAFYKKIFTRQYVPILVLIVIIVAVVGYSFVREYSIYKHNNTAAYTKQQMLAPTISLAGADLSKTKKAVSALHRRMTETAELFEDDFVVESVLPVKFLYLQIHTERARRIFMERPSLLTARIYQRHVIATFEQYYSSLQEAEREVAQHVGTVETWQGTTSSSFVALQLHEQAARVEKSIAIAYQWNDCLTKIATPCPIPSYTTPTAGAVDSKDPENAKQILTNKDILEEFLYNIRTRKSFAYDQRFPLSTMPVALLSSALCPSSTNIYLPYFLSWQSARADMSIPAARINGLNFLYFYNFRDVPTNSFLSTAYKATPHDYTMQQSNPYLCVDHGVDMQRVLTMHYIRSILVNNPIFITASEEASDSVKYLQTLESEVRSADMRFLHEQTVGTYAASLRDYLVNLDASQEEVLTPSQLKTAYEVVHVWRDQSGWYETAIGATVDTTAYDMLAVANEQRAKIPTFVFILTYSGIPTTFQLSNISLTENSDDAISLLEKRSPNNLIKFPHIHTYTGVGDSVWPTTESLLEYLRISEKDLWEAEEKARQEVGQ